MKRFLFLILVAVIVLTAAVVYAAGQVRKITPETTKLVLAPNVTWELFWSVDPADAADAEITWTSSNSKIATVDEKGIISAHSAGKCAITGDVKDNPKVKVKINVEVKAHDVVIIAPGQVNVDFDTEPQDLRSRVEIGRYVHEESWVRKFITQNGCVSSPSNKVLVPEKAGSDTITIQEIENGKTKKNKKYTVFVARSAVGEAPASSENGESEGILFLGIPWGTSYPEAKAALEGQGKKLKPLAQRNDYVRSVLADEVTFGNFVASSAAMNFSYTPGDEKFEENNALFKGDLYFDPEFSFENICQAVRMFYGLDQGKVSGDVCTWQQGNIKVVLTKKEKHTMLELICEKAE